MRATYSQPPKTPMKTATFFFLIVAAVGCQAAFPASESEYLTCIGASGEAPSQNILPLQSRAITSLKTKIRASIRINGANVEIVGVPYLSAGPPYKVCHDSDQELWFSPSGIPDFCAHNDQFDDLGVLNKVTGEVRYHMGEMLYVMNCKRAEKLVR